MRLRLIPREVKFFDLFEKDAENVHKGALLLQDLCHDFRNVEEKVSCICQAENDGDSITHDINEQINKTFVTPFDREDILALTCALDDVMDRMDAAADAMVIYAIDEPTEKARQLVDVIVKSTEQIVSAIPLLRDRRQMMDILQYCIEINRLENEADTLQRQALTVLFAKPDNLIDVVRWKEIYDQLEAATDRCEDVADVLQAMVMKHA